MAKRIKKPPVKPEVRQSWLKRHEQGESPPDIARSDQFDVRTVRRHIELAKQEREVKEARFTVLRSALEQHYKDLCDYAQKLDSMITRQSTVIWSDQDDHLRAALRQHLPRSPIWGYLNQWNGLQQSIAQLKTEADNRLEQVIGADSRLNPVSSAGETGVIPGIIVAIGFQLEQWAQVSSGLNLKDNLITEKAEEGFVNLRYGFAQMDKVKKEHVAIVHEVLNDCELKIKQCEEYQKLEKLFFELRRVQRNLRDELAVIILRRVVPGRCRYCPI